MSYGLRKKEKEKEVLNMFRPGKEQNSPSPGRDTAGSAYFRRSAVLSRAGIYNAGSD